jgi:outer membrane murein-binding lipoprotein Lpp
LSNEVFSHDVLFHQSAVFYQALFIAVQGRTQMLAVTRLPVAICVSILLCGCAPKLTPEQQQTLTQLKLDREAVKAEVAATKVEDARYSGGLIKAYIAMRLEILKTNDALLQQRIDALESGAKMNIVLSAVKSDPEKVNQLAADLTAQREKLTQAKGEADRYSGGLIQALSLTTCRRRRKGARKDAC